MHLHRAIERLFGTKILPHEKRLVLLLTLDLFAVLTVYYILKSVREPLILLEGGAVERNTARGAQAVILTVLVPLYSALTNRLSPRRLVALVYVACLGMLLAFPLLMRLGVKTGFLFFVWLGLFSLMAVAQFWSLANDVLPEEAGKRLFPVVAAGATVGALVGSQAVVWLGRWLHPDALILLAASLLALAIWLTLHVRRTAEPPHTAHANRLAATPTTDRRDGFRIVLQDRYLLAIGVSILLLNLVNTTGDQALAILIQEHAAKLPDQAARARFIMRFYGSLQTWISALTAAFQVFVVGRVVKAAGLRGGLLILPLVAFTGYACLAWMPALVVGRGFKIFGNSTEYSLHNTLQQVLFLPTSREAKYKGKTTTDTFFVRSGDLASWALVAWAMKSGWGARGLSIANLGVVALWLGVVMTLANRYLALSAAQRDADDARARALDALVPVAALSPAAPTAQAVRDHQI